MKAFLRKKILKQKPCSSCENYLKQYEIECQVCGTPLPEEVIQEMKKELKKKQRFVIQINSIYLSIYLIAGILLIKYLSGSLPYVLAFLIIYFLIFVFALTLYIYFRIKEKKTGELVPNRTLTILLLLNAIIAYGTMITFVVLTLVGLVYGILYLVMLIIWS